MTISTQIILTPTEKLLRQCLLQCRDSMQDVPGMKELELRWTGGWVRDKLMGNQSNDIDVALSTMTGWQFGQALQKYMLENKLHLQKQAALHNVKSNLKQMHKIEANPEKSKHLETITTKIFGIDVDFVNLRKEIYDDNSRNPQVEFGTPEEDALRRDACVNALFYNLDTQSVEDFTKRGLDDMKAKLIRTPLPPYQTFKDDPLRVLRLIRFAARFDFQIVPEALQAMQDQSIHEALVHKISRERVGVEVGKIMTGPRAYAGLKQIYDLNLYRTVFGSANIEDADCAVAMDSLNRLMNQSAAICMVLKPRDDPTLAWTLAAYVPFRENLQAALSAARNEIRASNIILRALEGAVKYRADLVELVNRVNQGLMSRSDVGMALRRSGAQWRSHVLYTLLSETVDEPFESVAEKYAAFVRYIVSEKLESADKQPPLLRGDQVTQILGIQTAGPWIRDSIDILCRWQFDHPEATSANAATFVRENQQIFPAPP